MQMSASPVIISVRTHTASAYISGWRIGFQSITDMPFQHHDLSSKRASTFMPGPDQSLFSRLQSSQYRRMWHSNTIIPQHCKTQSFSTIIVRKMILILIPLLANDERIIIPGLLGEDTLQKSFHATHGGCHRAEYRIDGNLTIQRIGTTSVRNPVEGWAQSVKSIKGRWNANGTTNLRFVRRTCKKSHTRQYRIQFLQYLFKAENFITASRTKRATPQGFQIR